MSDIVIPSITVMADGPYQVSGLTHIDVMPQKEVIELPRGKILLCGCGHSSKMPRCDGSHEEIEFESKKSPNRIPTKDKDYFGEHITVHFDLAVCAHVAICVRKLPRVFDTKKRPWINPDQGSVDAIVKIVRACPSGALSYTLKGEKRVDSFQSEPRLIYNTKGPFEAWGSIKLEGTQAPKVADHYTLCSCGKSKNHPFCDGEHR